jgi:S-adenosylmethionine:tRNA ribosyltransferase-isomerase
MLVSDFDYYLPKNLIANHPPATRGNSRLLVLRRQNGQLTDKKYSDLAEFLQPGDVLVLNDTKVIKARLKLYKVSSGATREIIVLERHDDRQNWHRHHVMYRGSLNVGDELTTAKSAPPTITVQEILGGGIAIVSSKIDLLKLSEKIGTPPLPPYINRAATRQDIKRYQTVFAQQAGSAAAPTASLNMTKELLEKLAQKGVVIKYLTLHVGLGTFLPIRSETIEDHPIHTEYFSIPADTAEAIQQAKQSGHRVVAAGTTVARTLEYAAGKILTRQKSLSGEADIFIYPGHQFKIVDALLTNFHAPRSTVLMLAAAFAGWENLQTAYVHAQTQQYKFLSYGDSMLIL